METSESENDVADSESDQCRDTMAYCSSMVNYCDNDEYQGVRIYCQKTCNSCDVEIDISEVTANATVGESGNDLIFFLFEKGYFSLLNLKETFQLVPISHGVKISPFAKILRPCGTELLETVRSSARN